MILGPIQGVIVCPSDTHVLAHSWGDLHMLTQFKAGYLHLHDVNPNQGFRHPHFHLTLSGFFA